MSPATVPMLHQRTAPLHQAGGILVVDDLVSRERCRRLLQEASGRLEQATESRVTGVDKEEIRGGNPARRFVSTPGGQEQMCLYQCSSTINRLSELCGTSVRPTGKCGTFTFYRPGDFLSLHRDIESCDVSVITCLLDRHEPHSRGGMTQLYPHRQSEPLSQVRATPGRGGLQLRLPVGSTLVFLGGLIPHLIETLGPKDLRIVSILCYRLCGDDAPPLPETDCGCGCSDT